MKSPVCGTGERRGSATKGVESSCRLLIVPLFRGGSRFQSLILTHHSRFTGECNEAETDDDVDNDPDYLQKTIPKP